jgi:hypothetical protein
MMLRTCSTQNHNSVLRLKQRQRILRMIIHITTDGRLLGFDIGDWSMLLGGFVLAGLLTLLV